VATRDRIVVGASAGGIRALEEMVAGLPADLPAAVMVVMQTSVDSPRIFPQMLAKAGSLPARYAVDREIIRDGTMYALHQDKFMGPPSAFTFPDCGGALWEMTDGALLRWRCHVGHAFTVDGLLAGQTGPSGAPGAPRLAG
jgi:CheB methylesterase